MNKKSLEFEVINKDSKNDKLKLKERISVTDDGNVSIADITVHEDNLVGMKSQEGVEEHLLKNII